MIKYIPIFLMLLILPNLSYSEQPDSTAMDWTGFKAEAESAPERAATRTDAKFGIKEYTQTLDSLIASIHADFLKKYRLKVASLISSERANRQVGLEVTIDLIAECHAKLIIAVWDNDTEKIDRLCQELKRLQIHLVDAVVKLRNIRQD